MTHALILFIIVLGAGDFASHIPLAVLAGILIKVGIDIIDWRFLRRVHKAPIFVMALMTSVWGLTVFVDLITAVAVGVSALFIETHEDPDNAPCDGPNMIPIEEMKALIGNLARYDSISKES